MSGESSSICHCRRETSEDDNKADSFYKPRRPEFRDERDCLRTNHARSAGQNVLGKSMYGRRRTESAPDALLDCLHCGKDLLDVKERVAKGSKRHVRRYSVASEKVWSPRKPTSLRRSFSQQCWSEERTECEFCKTDCVGGSKRKSGENNSRKRISSAGPCWHHRGDEQPSVLEKGVSKTNREQSGGKYCVSCHHARNRVSHADKHQQIRIFDESSGDDSLPQDTPCRQTHPKLTARSKKSTPVCKGGDDNDDQDDGLFNLNENRHHRSTTKFAQHSHKKSGDRSTRRTKSKRHSDLEQVEKRACPLHNKYTERQRDDPSKKIQSHNHPTARQAGKSRFRQHLTSSDETDNSDESETGETVINSRPVVCPRDSLLVANLSDMLRRHHLCDVILRTHGKEVHAHKLALAAFSDVFARTYCEGDSRREVVIDIPDTSVGGIQEVLRFIYTGSMRLNADNVGKVLAVATFLRIDLIVYRCKQLLLNPDVDTVVFFSTLVEKYHLQEELTYFYDFICKHFLRVSRTRGWKTLTFGQVFDLLSDDNLNVDRELDVFHAAVAWIDGDRASRLTFAPDLIGCVRFSYISPEEIAKHVESKHFLFQGDEGKELLLCVYRHHALHTCGCQHGKRGHHLPRRHYVALETLPVHDATNSAFSPPRNPPYTQTQKIRPSITSASPTSARLHPQPNPQRSHGPSASSAAGTAAEAFPEDLILAVGGVNPFQPDEEDQTRQAVQFHPRLNRWSSFTRLPDGRHHHGAVLLAGCLYVIGGSIVDDMNPEQLCNPSSSCLRYDLATKRWSDMAPLNVPRMYHATTVLNNVIFVVAGQTQQARHLASMECYRPEVGEWETGVELSEGRIGVAVAPYRGKLYAVGGFLETGKEHVVRDTVELFDPRTNSWSSLKGLPSPRCHAALAECGGRLYLVGGSTFPANTESVCSLPSLLRYDDKDDRWDRIQTLRTPRHDMGVAVLGSRIFVVGGVSSVDSKVLDDVECYDVETNYWLDDVAAISSPALGLVCVTLQADQ